MKKQTVVEWATRRRDRLRERWERTTSTEVKVRVGVQAAELTKVLDYIAAHPLRSENQHKGGLER